ncbi:MAG: hypothetical protein ACRC2V_26325, partial [Xenococcaceae cyanobacterium]
PSSLTSFDDSDDLSLDLDIDPNLSGLELELERISKKEIKVSAQSNAPAAPSTQQSNKADADAIIDAIEDAFKDVAKQLGKGNFLGALTSTLAIPFKTTGAVLRSLSVGAIQRVGENLSDNFSKELSSALEENLFKAFGSSGLLGEKIGEGVGKFVSKTLGSVIAKTSEVLDIATQIPTDPILAKASSEQLKEALQGQKTNLAAALGLLGVAQEDIKKILTEYSKSLDVLIDPNAIAKFVEQNKERYGSDLQAIRRAAAGSSRRLTELGRGFISPEEVAGETQRVARVGANRKQRASLSDAGKVAASQKSIQALDKEITSLILTQDALEPEIIKIDSRLKQLRESVATAGQARTGLESIAAVTNSLDDLGDGDIALVEQAGSVIQAAVDERIGQFRDRATVRILQLKEVEKGLQEQLNEIQAPLLQTLNAIKTSDATPEKKAVLVNRAQKNFDKQFGATVNGLKKSIAQANSGQNKALKEADTEIKRLRKEIDDSEGTIADLIKFLDRAIEQSNTEIQQTEFGTIEQRQQFRDTSLRRAVAQSSRDTLRANLPGGDQDSALTSVFAALEQNDETIAQIITDIGQISNFLSQSDNEEVNTRLKSLRSALNTKLIGLSRQSTDLISQVERLGGTVQFEDKAQQELTLEEFVKLAQQGN